MGIKQEHHDRRMRVVLALVIAALSAIESVLLAWLGISIFVPPGGSGEFSGINRFTPTLVSIFLLPPLAFAIVLILVLHYCTPANRKDFRNFAMALVVALVAAPVVRVFDTNPTPYSTPWHLITNAIVLFVWTVVILWRRVTRDEDSSLQTLA
jgi:hypothetical protein